MPVDGATDLGAVSTSQDESGREPTESARGVSLDDVEVDLGRRLVAGGTGRGNGQRMHPASAVGRVVLDDVVPDREPFDRRFEVDVRTPGRALRPDLHADRVPRASAEGGHLDLRLAR